MCWEFNNNPQETIKLLKKGVVYGTCDYDQITCSKCGKELYNVSQPFRDEKHKKLMLRLHIKSCWDKN